MPHETPLQQPMGSAQVAHLSDITPDPVELTQAEADVIAFYSQYATLSLPNISPRSHYEALHRQSMPYNMHTTAQYPSFAMDNMAAALPTADAMPTRYASQSPAQQGMQHHTNLSNQMHAPHQYQQPAQSSQSMRQPWFPPHGSVAHGSAHQYSQLLPGPIYTPYQLHLQQQAAPTLFSSQPPVHHAQQQGLVQQAMMQNYVPMSPFPQVYPGQPQGKARGQFVDHRYPPRATSLRQGTIPGMDSSLSSDFSRGPPKKPRQSGHALWVGNLPPGATVTELKDFFSRGATADIESVKLISKSNCTFVNYRSETACIAAMARFHEARLSGNRLVCRLRRSTAEPAQPGTLQPHSTSNHPTAGDEVVIDSEGVNPRHGLPERFFVLKSLTTQDLDVSVKTGLWATQAHNEAVLDDAFKNSEAVYLFFSANKSGEYFGCAKMTSTLSQHPFPTVKDLKSFSMQGLSPAMTYDEETSSAVAMLSSVGQIASGTRSTAVATPATQWAPKGRIIDDLARGTIFWEADTDQDAIESGAADGALDGDGGDAATPLDQSSSESNQPRASEVEDEPSSATLDGASDETVAPGNTFKIQWLSTRPMPFYKTRGLRNAWNANREVKIARDGTEIETEIGMKLMLLFGIDVLSLRQELPD